METLKVGELANRPGHLSQYFGNGGARIIDDHGKTIAEIPPAIEPIVDDEEASAVTDSDWLE